MIAFPGWAFAVAESFTALGATDKAVLGLVSACRRGGAMTPIRTDKLRPRHTSACQWHPIRDEWFEGDRTQVAVMDRHQRSITASSRTGTAGRALTNRRP